MELGVTLGLGLICPPPPPYCCPYPCPYCTLTPSLPSRTRARVQASGRGARAGTVRCCASAWARRRRRRGRAPGLAALAAGWTERAGPRSHRCSAPQSCRRGGEAGGTPSRPTRPRARRGARARCSGGASRRRRAPPRARQGARRWRASTWQARCSLTYIARGRVRWTRSRAWRPGRWRCCHALGRRRRLIRRRHQWLKLQVLRGWRLIRRVGSGARRAAAGRTRARARAQNGRLLAMARCSCRVRRVGCAARAPRRRIPRPKVGSWPRSGPSPSGVCASAPPLATLSGRLWAGAARARPPRRSPVHLVRGEGRDVSG